MNIPSSLQKMIFVPFEKHGRNINGLNKNDIQWNSNYRKLYKWYHLISNNSGHELELWWNLTIRFPHGYWVKLCKRSIILWIHCVEFIALILRSTVNQSNSSRGEALPQIQGKVNLQMTRCYQSELHPLDWDNSITMDGSPVCILWQETAAKSKLR